MSSIYIQSPRIFIILYKLISVTCQNTVFHFFYQLRPRWIQVFFWIQSQMHESVLPDPKVCFYSVCYRSTSAYNRQESKRIF